MPKRRRNQLAPCFLRNEIDVADRPTRVFADSIKSELQRGFDGRSFVSSHGDGLEQFQECCFAVQRLFG